MQKQDVQVEESAQVDEELVGKQHKLDVNKNKRLDSQDFKLLRAKKKVVEDIQTPERKKEMRAKLVQGEKKLQKAWNTQFKFGKKSSDVPTRVIDAIKAQRQSNDRLASKNKKEAESKKTYGKGGKVTEETEAIDEGKTAKIRRLQNRLGYKAANIRSGYAKDTPETQAKIKKLKSVASKLSAKQEKTNQRRAETQFPHSDPKIAKMDWDQRARVKGGSLRAIVKRDKPVRWYDPKDRTTQKEEANLEFTTGLPLQVPNPGDNIADPTKKGKRFHKKAK